MTAWNPRQRRTPVCGTCGHGHTTDLSSLNASGCADHMWTDACPYAGTRCPPAEERDLIIADLSRRMGAHLDDVFGGLLTEPKSILPAKPVTYEGVVEAMRKIRKSGITVRTEPIKLTPNQWAMLPHGTPTPYPLYQPLGDLMGIPVVMVNSEAESTPVAEGWIKRKPWWVRLWRKMRGNR